jgi:hypothetical protein
VSLTGGVTVKLNGDKVDVADLNGKLDDTTLSGNLSASASAITGAFKIGALNLDRYLSATAPAQGGAKAGEGKNAAPAKPKPAPAYPEVRLELAMESLRASNILIEDFKALIHGKAGQYAIDPCTFRFYESAVSLAARAQLAEQQYGLKATADNVNAGALLKDAAKMDKIGGRVNVQADLSLRGQDEAAVRRSLGGTARLTGAISADMGMLPSVWRSSGGGRLNVNNIDVTAKADKGHIVLKPIETAGDVSVNGQGTVDLPTDALDIRLDTNLLPVPLTVRGTLKNPSYGIDPTGALKNVLETPKAGGQAVEKGLKGLMKGF